jgi:hypothetical protein
VLCTVPGLREASLVPKSPNAHTLALLITIIDSCYEQHSNGVRRSSSLPGIVTQPTAGDENAVFIGLLVEIQLAALECVRSMVTSRVISPRNSKYLIENQEFLMQIAPASIESSAPELFISTLLRMLCSLTFEQAAKPSVLILLLVNIIEVIFCDSHASPTVTHPLAIMIGEEELWLNLFFRLCESEMVGVVKSCSRIVLALLKESPPKLRASIEINARHQGKLYNNSLVPFIIIILLALNSLVQYKSM